MMKPVIWTFRRCPYAIRARLAVSAAGLDVEYREILLRDKPKTFLEVNPEGTVPVLVEPGGAVKIHSLDIMRWALLQKDPDGWLDYPADLNRLIDETKGGFKAGLDRYKYHTRYAGADRKASRAEAGAFIRELEGLLSGKPWLTGRPTLPDMAVLPFVRQFAHVDLDWFHDQDWQSVSRWLEAFKASEIFRGVMVKRPLFQAEKTKA